MPIPIKLLNLVKKGIGWASIPELLAKQALKQGAMPVAHESNGWITSIGCLASHSHANGPVLMKLIEQ